MREIAAFVLHCLDPRIQIPVEDYLQSKGLRGRTAICSIAGDCLNLAGAAEPSDARFVHRQFAMALNGSVNTQPFKIVLVTHDDCKAYKRFGKRSIEEERELHHLHAEVAKQVLRPRFPKAQFIHAIAKRNEATNEFVIEEAGTQAMTARAAS